MYNVIIMGAMHQHNYNLVLNNSIMMTNELNNSYYYLEVNPGPILYFSSLVDNFVWPTHYREY